MAKTTAVKLPNDLICWTQSCRFREKLDFGLTLSPSSADAAQKPDPGKVHRAPSLVTKLLTRGEPLFPAQRDSSFTDTKACVPGKKPKGWGDMSKEEQRSWAEAMGVRPGKIEVAFYGPAADYKGGGKRFPELPHGPLIRFCQEPLKRAPLHPVQDLEEAVVVARRYAACVQGGKSPLECAEGIGGPDMPIGGLGVDSTSRSVRRGRGGNAGVGGGNAGVDEYLADAARFLREGSCGLALHHYADAREAFGKSGGSSARKLDLFEKKLVRACVVKRRGKRRR